MIKYFSLFLALFVAINANSQSKPVPKTEEPYSIVEEMPEFPGGEDALIAFIQKTINYPKDAIQKKIEGVVYIQFVILSSGKISNPKIMKGIKELNKEAIRVMKLMPDWKPGRHAGKAVPVYYEIPITFHLPD